MTTKKLVRALAGPVVVMTCLGLLWAFRANLFPSPSEPGAAEVSASPDVGELTVLELSEQARKNLGLISKPMKPTDYWRSVTIPGMVQDRPGVSDRGVTSPVVGVISQLHVYPGDTVRPGEPLVTIHLFSEYLQATQSELFEATQEIALLQAEIERLSAVAGAGGVARSRLIELDNGIKRQQAMIQSARQELLTRGLSPLQIEEIEVGNFISTLQVVAPNPKTSVAESFGAYTSQAREAGFVDTGRSEYRIAYEVQDLAVELGSTVQAGQLIADLSNHSSLYVVGHAFKREAVFLERAAQESREISIEFADDSPSSWSAINQPFSIRHLSNSIDPNSRTFDFFVPLTNQSRTYEKDGETFLVWRFRPGQRARIQVPVERISDVFVMPSEGVVHEGPEAYVFRQNGDLFNQISVHVLHQDRRNVIIANDGRMTPGAYFAQNAAESLNRVLKAQSASGEQPGLHVHPDGTVHAAH